MKFFLLIIAFLSFAFKSNAQDTLLLMNGRELNCNIIQDSGTVYVFEITKRNGKIKVQELHKNDVFSIKKEGEEEHILYAQNEFLGDIYTVDEMRFYLAGENDARQNFTAWPTFIVGFVMCGTIAFIGQDGWITAMLPPLAYTIAQLFPKIKIRANTMSSESYKYNDMYADGYEPPARSRKLFRAMEGAYGGAAAGILAWLVFVKK